MRSRLLHCDFCGAMAELEDTIGWTFKDNDVCGKCNESLRESTLDKLSKIARVSVPSDVGYDIIGTTLLTPDGRSYPIKFDELGQLEYREEEDYIDVVIYYTPDKLGNIPGIRSANIVWYQE